MKRMYVKYLAIAAVVLCGSTLLLFAQDVGKKPTNEELQRGTNLLAYEDYSDVDPMPLVEKYEGLRVTDVLDAMQAIGLQDIGLMDHDIRP
ncbi:MAG: hypothetical protein ACYTAS_19500, partial [Planctomycetota bacterium]